MNSDDALRAALRQENPAVRPDWDGVRRRAHRIHRERRIAQGAVALVLLVAVTLGALAASGAFDADTDRSIVATPTEQQGEIVVAFDDRIVVMTTDGEIVRTVLDGLDLVGNISVSPDGGDVYFARLRETCEDGSTRPAWLARVALAGGRLEDLSLPASNPLVSPDGRRVAYEIEEECAPGAHFLGITDLVSGDHERPLDRVGYVPPRAIRPVSWSPDSRRLMYERSPGPGRAPFGVVEVAGLSHGLDTPVFADDVTAAAFSDDGSFVAAHDAGPADVYAVTRIGDLGGQPAGDHEVLFRAARPPPDLLLPEPRGTRLVLRVADRTLQIQEGSAAPTTIAADVEGAAWLPKAESSPVAGDPPARVVALTLGGDLIEINTESGRQTRAIVNVGPVSLDAQVAVSRDGAIVYAERRHGSIDCPSGDDVFASEIVAVDRSSGRVEVVDRGRWPTVSPDGSALAYVTADGCGERGDLALLTPTSGESRRVPVGPLFPAGANLAGPLSFAPDPAWMVVQARLGPTRDAWVIDSVADGESMSGHPIPDSRSTRYHLARIGLLGLVVVEGFPTVAVIDLRDGSAGKVFEFAVAPGEGPWELAGSDASGHELLLVSGVGTEGRLWVASRDGETPTGWRREHIGPDGVVAAAWAR